MLRSGRLTTAKPKSDNLAKENELIPEVNVRKAFVAKEGCKFLKIDVSGQELRIAANNAKDETMIGAFQKNYDVHMVVTKKRLGLGIPWEHLVTTHPEYKQLNKDYEAERTKFKGVNFGTIYGKTKWSFAKEWKCSAWDAQSYIDAVFDMFPKLKTSIARNKAFLKKNLYSVTWMGRRRRYDVPITKHDVRSSYNHTVQGSAADMMKQAVGVVWRYLQTLDFEARIVLWIHDEIIIEAPENRIQELVEPVMYRMNNTIKCEVPFTSEAKIVNSYGE
jgi:DNA polymerase I